MSRQQLQVRINRKAQTAVFGGSATFQLKDQIKALGRAKWLGDLKQWQISAFTLSHAELEQTFPGVEIVLLEEEFADEPLRSAPSQNEGGRVSSRASSPARIDTPDTARAIEPSALSVGQLSTTIQGLIRRAFANTVVVYGVVAKVSRSQGRIFLDLVDRDEPTETIRCTIWESAEKLLAGLRAAGFELEANLEVMFEVQVGWNRKRSEVSLSIQRVIHDYTLSKVLAERERTNERLKQEGIYERNRTLKLPFLPRKLGILTSSAGTVINDFLAGLEPAHFGFELVRLHVNVQGEGAKRQVVQGITRLQEVPGLDAILLFRGGGSPAELGVFNDYEIAKSICLCPIPVLSAIGHQEDQSSAQDVSYLHFGVPKDLGHFFARLVQDLRDAFKRNGIQIGRSVERKLALDQQRFDSLSRAVYDRTNALLRLKEQRTQEHCRSLPRLAALSFQGEERHATGVFSRVQSVASERLRFIEHRLGSLAQRLIGSASGKIAVLQARLDGQLRSGADAFRIVERREGELRALERVVSDASPEVQLKRGFALLRRSNDGVPITTKAALQAGQEVVINLQDGDVLANIQ